VHLVVPVEVLQETLVDGVQVDDEKVVHLGQLLPACSKPATGER
jgi:hypothetical protein